MLALLRPVFVFEPAEDGVDPVRRLLAEKSLDEVEYLPAEPLVVGPHRGRE
jgi:hypothetical protein